jgi:hypothetical protein
MNRYFVGCDPGISGALVLFSENKKVLQIKDTPKLKKVSGVDYVKLYQSLEDFHKIVEMDSKEEVFKIYLSMENPSWSPVFSRATLMSFGQTIGAFRMALTSFMLNHPLTVEQEVFQFTPKLWQKFYLAKGEKTSKEKSVESALTIVGPNELLPLTLHQGQRGDRAEAILVANYCRAIIAEEVVKIPNKRNPKKTPRKKPSTRKTTKMKHV